MKKLRKKHQKTLDAIQRHPVPSNIKHQDFEAMIIALGYVLHEDTGGSVVAFQDEQWIYHYHRPHPRKEVDKGALVGFIKHLKLRGEL